MIATPAFQGVEAGYAFAMFETAGALKDAGIACEVAILTGDPHVDHSRNRLVKRFLASDCTDLVFIDADIRWEAKDLLALVSYDRDVVAGIYPLKKDDEDFPVKFLGGEIWSDADGLIDVEGVPTGFLRIRRNVLERLALAAPKFRHGSDPTGEMTPHIFERVIDGDQLWGGDYTFCRKARAIGFGIYVDPKPHLEHSGIKTWQGSLGSYLRRINKRAISQGLAAIRAGLETTELLNDMALEWDNPWSLTVEELTYLIALVRETKGPILECGSGLSTLVMAAANPDAELWSLEDDDEWMSRVCAAAKAHNLDNVGIQCMDLRDGWYSLPPAPKHFALAVVDGPAKTEDRLGILRSGLTADVYFIDDVQDEAEITRNFGPAVFLGKNRRFAIARPSVDAQEAAE